MTPSYAQRNEVRAAYVSTPRVLQNYAPRTHRSSTINIWHQLRVQAHFLKSPDTLTPFQAPETIPSPRFPHSSPRRKIYAAEIPEEPDDATIRGRSSAQPQPLSSNLTSEFIPLLFNSFHVLGGEYKYITNQSIIFIISFLQSFDTKITLCLKGYYITKLLLPNGNILLRNYNECSIQVIHTFYIYISTNEMLSKEVKSLLS